MKGKPREKNENWLLRKVEDDHAGPADSLTGRALTSVKTGRTMQEIADNATPRKQSKAAARGRSEEHTSELQSLMRRSYAVFCLKKKKKKTNKMTQKHKNK